MAQCDSAYVTRYYGAPAAPTRRPRAPCIRIGATTHIRSFSPCAKPHGRAVESLPGFARLRVSRLGFDTVDHHGVRRRGFHPRHDGRGEHE